MIVSQIELGGKSDLSVKAEEQRRKDVGDDQFFLLHQTKNYYYIKLKTLRTAKETLNK